MTQYKICASENRREIWIHVRPEIVHGCPGYVVIGTMIPMEDMAWEFT